MPKQYRTTGHPETRNFSHHSKRIGKMEAEQRKIAEQLIHEQNEYSIERLLSRYGNLSRKIEREATKMDNLSR